MSPTARMSRWPSPCLMLVTDRTRLRGRAMEEVVSRAVDGGVNVVQLREKDLPTAELYDLAVTVHAVVRGRALLVVNDRLDVALAAGADGVHLPERNLPSEKVWDLAGDACVVGRSVHSVESAVQAEADGMDYVLLGTVFETASKPGSPPAGVELVSRVRDAVNIPLIAIGGINAENAADVIKAGADGVAVIGALMDAEDPEAAARELREAIDTAYEA
jgi:thiamine-phosphate pyrophosphorylase